MRVVVGLGGNPQLRRGESAEASTQRAYVLEAASALAGNADEHVVVVPSSAITSPRRDDSDVAASGAT